MLSLGRSNRLTRVNACRPSRRSHAGQNAHEGEQRHDDGGGEQGNMRRGSRGNREQTRDMSEYPPHEDSERAASQCECERFTEEPKENVLLTRADGSPDANILRTFATETNSTFAGPSTIRRASSRDWRKSGAVHCQGAFHFRRVPLDRAEFQPMPK